LEKSTCTRGCSAVVFLVSPGFQLAAVKIFDAAVYGEIGIASATTIKLVAIVMVCMMILNYITNKTKLGSSTKKSAAV
jgi:iron(III) transport system permease protein